MSIVEARILRELQQQVAVLGALVEQLVEEQAEQAGRLAAVEAAAATECGACTARRAHDAARQRRLRRRHATAAVEPV